MNHLNVTKSNVTKSYFRSKEQSHVNNRNHLNGTMGRWDA